MWHRPNLWWAWKAPVGRRDSGVGCTPGVGWVRRVGGALRVEGVCGVEGVGWTRWRHRLGGVARKEGAPRAACVWHTVTKAQVTDCRITTSGVDVGSSVLTPVIRACNTDSQVHITGRR